MTNKWFKKAVKQKPPDSLGGWSKKLPAEKRRKKALASRPKNWSMKRKSLSTARALQALANVTKDTETRNKATSDAKYFYTKYRKTNRK